jgi:uncharacterized membrane protein YhaH (DUF805 family)
LGPMQSITICLRKSFDFSGRASRAEFWWFAPVGLCIPILVALFAPPQITNWVTLAIKVLTVAVACAPFTSAASRRFQDTDAPYQDFWVGIGPTLGLIVSGWVLGLALFGVSTIIFALPGLIIGIPAGLAFLTCLVLAPGTFGTTLGQLLVPSSPGPNRYGPNPREVTP